MTNSSILYTFVAFTIGYSAVILYLFYTTRRQDILNDRISKLEESHNGTLKLAIMTSKRLDTIWEYMMQERNNSMQQNTKQGPDHHIIYKH